MKLFSSLIDRIDEIRIEGHLHDLHDDSYDNQHSPSIQALIDRVNRTHEPIVISKRGKPLAKLVPLDSDRDIEARILERLRDGEGGMLVDEKTFLRPTSDIAGWPQS